MTQNTQPDPSAKTLLDVFLHEHCTGHLSVAGGRLSFSYLAEWLASPIAAALSVSLPLQQATFDDKQTRPFFSGLLPEGTMRRLLAQQFGVSQQNDFALLGRIGGECAGAVRLMQRWLPSEGMDSRLRGNDITRGNDMTGLNDGIVAKNEVVSIQWLSDQELLAVLDKLPLRPMLAGQDGLRLSLAGAQDKLPVCARIDPRGRIQIGLPLGGQPSTHILKPAISSVEDSVNNECFCLNLAFAMGLHTAKAQVVTVEDISFLLVERYDRRYRSDGADGALQRLHQEDFCQALGIVPEQKYQNEGGPSFAALFAMLRQVTRPSAPQVLRLLDYAVFNLLVGNHDAHGKNYSLLRVSSGIELAPMYDVLCTAVYPHLTSKMAMKIGNKYKFQDLAARHWEQFAQAAGLSPAQTKRRVLALASQLPEAAKALQIAPHSGFEGTAIVGKIIELIEQRCDRITRLLQTP
jgi:serine/threonine-protein kinase HipA